MTPPDHAVRVTVDGAIARITLHRPAKLNALSRVVLEQLIDAAASLNGRPEVSVAVVSGEGLAFSAGFDLHDRTWAEIGPLSGPPSPAGRWPRRSVACVP